MSVTIHIPTILRVLTNDQKTVTSSGNSVKTVIENLDVDFPGIKARLVENEQVHGFINLYVNDEDIRFGEGLNTAVSAGDAITILPAVAGG
ncbi:MoaD/ThiS family protein [Photobacterium sp. WH77]|uniref:MoaD/ThiS family protein n=1 Tax=Photobacterium arenosum TaxID=2774143 RepID=A0ABR9BN21_9GAMM|nr:MULTISPECIES: MoaD/ThiS family protein [Photobacterium]MBD8513716.1 MoaD/ThiS family protein [Photobacterium arenosum]MCG2839060.1 MoaD/ThiS family protein [Photobacterium sp. WH77]MCG2846677.1 MoaD/ThiS family protein [Photobacterium sp. WH80]MDO6582510.1 MoaD/ThiS family protein [Photobacterium sp. 2_MG-2023]